MHFFIVLADYLYLLVRFFFFPIGVHKHQWCFSQYVHHDNRHDHLNRVVLEYINLLLITVKGLTAGCILCGCQDTKTVNCPLK